MCAAVSLANFSPLLGAKRSLPKSPPFPTHLLQLQNSGFPSGIIVIDMSYCHKNTILNPGNGFLALSPSELTGSYSLDGTESHPIFLSVANRFKSLYWWTGKVLFKIYCTTLKQPRVTHRTHRAKRKTVQDDTGYTSWLTWPPNQADESIWDILASLDTTTNQKRRPAVIFSVGWKMLS